MSDECFVLQGGDNGLLQCQEWVGTGIIFLPMMTVVHRPSGRSKRLERKRVPMYSGYGFMRPDSLSMIDKFSARWGVTLMRHLTGAPVVVPFWQLDHARRLDRGEFDTPQKTPPPAPQATLQDIRAGDRVVLDLRSSGQWHGTVVSVSGTLARVEVDGSPFPLVAPLASCYRTGDSKKIPV